MPLVLCLAWVNKKRTTNEGQWIYLGFRSGQPGVISSFPQSICFTVLKALWPGLLNLTQLLAQYDLNLKGCSNPISTFNTDMLDKGQLEKHTLYVPGIWGFCCHYDFADIAISPGFISHRHRFTNKTHDIIKDSRNAGTWNKCKHIRGCVRTLIFSIFSLFLLFRNIAHGQHACLWDNTHIAHPKISFSKVRTVYF